VSRDMRSQSKCRWIFLLALATAVACGTAAAQEAPVPPAASAAGPGEVGTEKSYTYMGVSIDDLTERGIREANYPRKTGVIVSSVAPGSAADKAGIREDDIIYLFDGVKVETATQLVALVQKRKPGDRVPVTLYRDGAEKKLSVVLGKREASALVIGPGGKSSDELAKVILDVKGPALELYKQSFLMRGHLGMTLAELSEDLAPYFGVKPGSGVLILAVNEGSPAAKAGIKGGDILTSVNGSEVADASGVIDELSGMDAGDTASLGVIRKGARKTFEVALATDDSWYRVSTAPFEGERSAREEALEKKDQEEAAKLKQEMRALQERLKELEDRLDKAEKKE
jgi:S1-C subfamily serine protease